MFFSYFDHDPFNKRNNRNGFNTERRDYNCGGFALGTFSWYIPCPDDDWYGYLGEELNEEEMDWVTGLCIDKMLADFADLRLIGNLNEVHADEYAIAFKVSSDGDFHYCRQFHGRLWYHKPGGMMVESITEYEVLNTDWRHGRYDGELVLFAKKRKKIEIGG